MEALKKDKLYTYADYVKWDTEERYELIDGIPYLMTSPTFEHQDISGNLYGLLWNFLRGKPCKVLYAPFDVRLNAESADDTMVQPDILIVCDKSKIEKNCITGAPDMVIEILSPSTSRHDRVRKFNKYLQVGVREYWIVCPDDKTVETHILQNGAYITKRYEENDTIHVHILEGCKINLSDVFIEE